MKEVDDKVTAASAATLGAAGAEKLVAFLGYGVAHADETEKRTIDAHPQLDLGE